MDDYKERIKLIKTIEKYPCLWNPNCREYCREVVANTWIKVAKELSYDPATCRLRWKAMKSGYSIGYWRAQRDSVGNKESTYILAEHMKFMAPHVYQRKPPIPKISKDNNTDNNHSLNEKYVNNQEISSTTQPAEEEEEIILIEDSENSQDSFSEDVSAKLKRKGNKDDDSNHHKNAKKLYVEWSKRKTMDPNGNQLFLNSLHSHLENMTGKQIRRFQQKVITLIDEILEDADLPQVIFH